MRRYFRPSRIFAGIFLFLSVPLFAEARPASQVFNKWRQSQRIFQDVRIGSVRGLDDEYLRRFQRLVPAAIRPQIQFLQLPGGEMTSAQGAALRKSLRPLISGLDRPAKFLDHLKTNGFGGGPVNQKERKAPFGKVSEKYRAFLEALLADEDETRERTALFAAANAFFEYCFVTNDSECRAMTRRPGDYPLLRLMYSNMWYHLSGVGWQHWHARALDRLEARANAGDEITYIAGGTDIYRLLCTGITRIRIIDPMFPSQTKYYAEGWRFLVEPTGRGKDRITFTLEQDGINLVLIREKHRKTGQFASGQLSDKSKRDLPKTETVWGVFDDQGQRVGAVTFERRFVEQKDFEKLKGRTFLVSFNELNYVTNTGEGGWGLDPNAFPRALTMVVKQLRHPVPRAAMRAMNKMRDTDFYFIKLGTSIN